jgi:hypothetical protein
VKDLHVSFTHGNPLVAITQTHGHGILKTVNVLKTYISIGHIVKMKMIGFHRSGHQGEALTWG